jgi:hypothetical protein
MNTTTHSSRNPHAAELETLALVPVVLGSPSTRRSGEHRPRRPLLRRSTAGRVARGAATQLPSSENRVSVSR